MKAIMVMFDSLNRRMLPPYGCDWIHAPNFQRLAERTVTFDNFYIASAPCMPARRELHTGRYNLLHRSWGPIEPFDDSMPRILDEKGIHSHLASDHFHYWEEGGATYHTRYTTWELSRGQEGDPWKGQVADPQIPDSPSGRSGRSWRQDWVTRGHIVEEEDWPQVQTFRQGLEFIEANHDQDNWFLQIETFDPHEPFFAPQKYRDLYPLDHKDSSFDWPSYRPVEETAEQVQQVRYEYAALLSMCDAYLGKVLDKMDELDLWQDTMLIVNTDHGFLLGEHNWWAKVVQPFYNEVAHTPFFIWDPRHGRAGKRCAALAQTIDLAPTLLEFFGLDRPPDMLGVPLAASLAASGESERSALRPTGLFGIHGGHVNCTDGRYVYMRAPATPENGPLFDYTLMPTNMKRPFSLAELRDAKLAEPFSFTKGCPVLKVPAYEVPWDASASVNRIVVDAYQFGTLLFDVEHDPQQEHPIQDSDVEEKMIGHLTRLMLENDAPPEQFLRLGLSPP
jgi:arylsulfatase A-like enzyme